MELNRSESELDCKMYDQSELDELYDDFLNLDGNMFMDMDSNLLDQDLSDSEVDGKLSKLDLNGKNFNNNFITDFDLTDFDVNRNVDTANGNYLDKNGKV